MHAHSQTPTTPTLPLSMAPSALNPHVHVPLFPPPAHLHHQPHFHPHLSSRPNSSSPPPSPSSQTPPSSPSTSWLPQYSPDSHHSALLAYSLPRLGFSPRSVSDSISRLLFRSGADRRRERGGWRCRRGRWRRLCE